MAEKSLEYRRIHNTVRRVKGPAAKHDCIDGCGRKALDWSQRKGTAGLEVDDFDPRCRSCHSIYDGIVERSIGNKYGQANRGRVAPSEERARRSEFTKGRVHSEETKAKIRAGVQRQREQSRVIDPDS